MYIVNFVSAQFETSDDPLEKITTAEAIKNLIDFYQTSQHSYAAKEKVEGISKVVSILLPCHLFIHLVSCSKVVTISWKIFSINCRKELCWMQGAVKLVS